jgi:tartrate dehydrogenase/decarboxylase/D-malate dehydrogenase
MPEGLRVLRAAARRFELLLEFSEFDWASCDHYLRTGAMMPRDWKPRLQGMDALYFGAVGWPALGARPCLPVGLAAEVPPRVRPVRQPCAPCACSMACPARSRDARPGDIDFYVVRENTEGEYTNLGGRLFEGTERELVIQESVFTRVGADRVLRFAFELARGRARRHVTVATKSNGIAISMPWWDERADAMAANYPDVTVDKQHIDILSARFVLQPGASTWSWPPTCSATSSPTSAPPAPAPSASRPRPTSTRRASSRRCSSPSTARHPTSRERASRTRSR